MNPNKNHIKSKMDNKAIETANSFHNSIRPLTRVFIDDPKVLMHTPTPNKPIDIWVDPAYTVRDYLTSVYILKTYENEDKKELMPIATFAALMYCKAMDKNGVLIYKDKTLLEAVELIINYPVEVRTALDEKFNDLYLRQLRILNDKLFESTKSKQDKRSKFANQADEIVESNVDGVVNMSNNIGITPLEAMDIPAVNFRLLESSAYKSDQKQKLDNKTKKIK